MAPNLTPIPRIALVTGASQGIGRAIALRLAGDGLAIAVNDVPTKRQQLEDVVSEIQALGGGRAIAVAGDVSVEEDVKNMISSTVEQLGGLDVMVANAGILTIQNLMDSSVDDWDRTMAVNVRGTMLAYKYAAAQMIQQGRGGRIVGASSVAGKRGFANIPAYVASKFAVRGLTQSTALELAKHNITVNAYAPGHITTDMTRGDEEKRLGLAPGTMLSEALGIPAAAPLPAASPEVIASLVSHLVKPESHFITGQSISVNGGTYFD